MARPAAAPLAPRAVISPRADYLTRKHTAFRSFAALLDAEGGYEPSIRCISEGGETGHDLQELADLYDEAQESRGERRRAWRS